MVDILWTLTYINELVFMRVISWFINQQTSLGGAILQESIGVLTCLKHWSYCQWIGLRDKNDRKTLCFNGNVYGFFLKPIHWYWNIWKSRVKLCGNQVENRFNSQEWRFKKKFNPETNWGSQLLGTTYIWVIAWVILF